MFMYYLQMIPLFVAPFILMIFSLVSAYVFKFGVPKTGIGFDYILFASAVILGLLLGGAL